MASENDVNARVETTPVKADDTADGHQVTLDIGATVTSVAVTAQDWVTTRTYAVNVTRRRQSHTSSARMPRVSTHAEFAPRSRS